MTDGQSHFQAFAHNLQSVHHPQLLHRAVLTTCGFLHIDRHAELARRAQVLIVAVMQPTILDVVHLINISARRLAKTPKVSARAQIFREEHRSIRLVLDISADLVLIDEQARHWMNFQLRSECVCVGSVRHLPRRLQQHCISGVERIEQCTRQKYSSSCEVQRLTAPPSRALHQETERL